MSLVHRSIKASIRTFTPREKRFVEDSRKLSKKVGQCSKLACWYSQHPAPGVLTGHDLVASRPPSLFSSLPPPSPRLSPHLSTPSSISPSLPRQGLQLGSVRRERLRT